jgi:hypothetical protein
MSYQYVIVKKEVMNDTDLGYPDNDMIIREKNIHIWMEHHLYEKLTLFVQFKRK